MKSIIIKHNLETENHDGARNMQVEKVHDESIQISFMINKNCVILHLSLENSTGPIVLSNWL